MGPWAWLSIFVPKGKVEKMNTILISFNNFLCTGELCGIELGASRNLVFETFGPPSIWSESNTMNYDDATWWIYGKIQIRFTSDKVDTFGFYFTLNYSDLNFIIVQDMPNKNMDLNSVRAGIVKRPEDYRWSSIGYHA